MARESEQTPLPRMRTVIRYLKRCATSIAIGETQIKTTMRYHLIPVRMVIINKTGNDKCWRGCGEKGSLFTVGGHVNWYNH